MCTDTPPGFDVGPVRERLRGWVTRDTQMTIDDIVQVGGTGCFRRAHEWIPPRWGVSTLMVTCEAPDADFVASTATKLRAKTFKPRVCTFEYRKGNPIQGPESTFGNHWVLLIGSGTDTGGREFLIVYDPDVDATLRSKKKWAACQNLDRQTLPLANAVLEKLVLGKGDRLGGLIRYFFP